MKIHNKEDQTILEIKVQSREPKEDKKKPSVIIGILAVSLLAFILGIGLGYFFFRLQAAAL